MDPPAHSENGIIMMTSAIALRRVAGNVRQLVPTVFDVSLSTVQRVRPERSSQPAVCCFRIEDQFAGPLARSQQRGGPELPTPDAQRHPSVGGTAARMPV